MTPKFETEIAERITVRGLVQGVGFRPTVWRLATDFNVRGSIINNGEGVEIQACGAAADIENFVAALRAQAPPLARIDEINRAPVALLPLDCGFRIEASAPTMIRTGIVPDAATCEACRAETFDPAARRYRYPFTNCTHCGPRLSIIENIPYDRAQTTMQDFVMCEACRAEYANPADRRFHAQPICCPACGPKIRLLDANGTPYIHENSPSTDDIGAAIELIQHGFIVAIKGVGGYQLACDATREATVARLRALKHRERKPFALMVRDLEVARKFCNLSAMKAEVLSGIAAPIVILNRVQGSRFQVSSSDSQSLSDAPQATQNLELGTWNLEHSVAASVAPGVNTLGVMLPNTPLHDLLLQNMTHPIVLTSGNLSDEPQCTDDTEALAQLGGIADYFLTHDRPVAQRVDDSVVKIMAGEPRILRRARGYAPAPLRLPAGFETAPPLLAFGGELKNTFCLLRDGQAIVSQHIGDLADALTQTDYRHNLRLYAVLYQHVPTALVCDLHPEYLSTKLARAVAEEHDLPLLEIQHHHAHIAACLAENNVAADAPPVIGVALDGLGYGDDGTFWGGEFLLADYASYKRLAAFKPVALPGGEQAIRQPWRNTYAHLSATLGWGFFAEHYKKLELFEFLDKQPRAALDGMLQRGINAPLASSCGRLFDAVAAAIGIAREHAAFEGQGAIELEAIIDEKTWHATDEECAYPFAISQLENSGLPYIEPLPMWRALLDDLLLRVPASIVAARFHKGLAKIVVQVIESFSRNETNGDELKTVALSGGVWQNKILFEEVIARLRAKDFTVLTHRQLPPNDGGLALGQAAIAAARLINERR